MFGAWGNDERDILLNIPLHMTTLSHEEKFATVNVYVYDYHLVLCTVFCNVMACRMAHGTNTHRNLLPRSAGSTRRL
jgi:hypothetical protein